MSTGVVFQTDPQVDLEGLLSTRFGFDTFREGQREVIEHLLAGYSAAAVFPTGGGKSLCYQLPALVFPGVTLVVSPLIALMKDQIDALAARNIPAVRLDSTLSADEYRKAVRRIRSGELRMLYVAPERFNNERFRQLVGQLDVSLFAIDEAHCISEWGHNFRPDYLKLARFAQECGADRIFALTATATPGVLDDVCRQFRIEPSRAVRTGFYRPNLTLLTQNVSAAQRDRRLVETIESRPRGATIVYVTLQRTAEEVATMLASHGLPARAYHAGLDNELRAETQEWFLGSDQAIIVATIAFGMGIDKPDIRYVYHYNLAKSLENFSQEMGRAGRDGAPAICETLACGDDLKVLENFVYGDTPSKASLRSLIEDLCNRPAEFGLSVYQLAHEHDIRDLVIRTMLTYLELDGYLEGGTPYYNEYRFQPLVDSNTILDQFDPQRRKFLATLLAQAKKGKTWLTLDLDAAALATQSDRERVVRALDYLAEKQWLEVKASGVHLKYRRLKLPADRDALAADLHRRALDREANELKRLEQMVQLIQQPDCQVAAVGKHFGDDLGRACGHCTRCLDKARPAPLSRTGNIAMDPTTWQQVPALYQENPVVFFDPTTLSRFLCGITSPRFARARLRRHKLFGAFVDVPFQRVLTCCEDQTREK